MNYDRPDLLDHLAAAQVFGTLGRLPRRRFARLARELPAAAVALARWEAHAATLAAPVPAVAPSPALWQAIEARTGGAAAPASASSARRRPWWAPALAFGFGLFLAVGLVRLYPEVVLPPAPVSEALPESYVGLLLDAAGNPTVLASSRRHGREMSIKMLRPVTVPAGKVLRLWALPKDGPPFPVGELPASGKGGLTLAATSEELFSTVPRLAASLEDPGPAPATPGAFLLEGHCVKLW